MFCSRKWFLGSLALVVLASPLACAGGSNDQNTNEGSQAQTETAAGGMSASSSGAGTFVGVVGETFEAADYTYVRLEREGESVWAAGPKSAVQVGEELSIALTMPMKGFRSAALDRTFETLYFVNAFERGGGGAAGSDHPRAEAEHPHGGAEHPHAGGGDETTDPDAAARTAAPQTDLALEGIEKAPGGHSISEIWAQKEGLAGTSVAVRGRVVKYNSGIMGRNWLHIQDGSGDTSAGDHDLTVTSETAAKVGDIVTVRGVLTRDKDFGAGYSYAVIIEDAEVQVEADAAR